MSLSEELEPYIRCPNCRNLKLIQLADRKWKCTACGYWTISPPVRSIQESRHLKAGTETPLTPQQKAALRRGRDYWRTLIRVGKKQALGILTIFTALSFLLNLTIWAALDQTLAISWTITAWVASAFLGIVGLLLFYSSSAKRRAIFVMILVLFLASGRFWYELTLRALASI